MVVFIWNMRVEGKELQGTSVSKGGVAAAAVVVAVALSFALIWSWCDLARGEVGVYNGNGGGSFTFGGPRMWIFVRPQQR